MIAVQIAGHYESALQMAASGSPLTWDKLPKVSIQPLPEALTTRILNI